MRPATCDALRPLSRARLPRASLPPLRPRRRASPKRCCRGSRGGTSDRRRVPPGRNGARVGRTRRPAQSSPAIAGPSAAGSRAGRTPMRSAASWCLARHRVGRRASRRCSTRSSSSRARRCRRRCSSATSCRHAWPATAGHARHAHGGRRSHLGRRRAAWRARRAHRAVSHRSLRATAPAAGRRRPERAALRPSARRSPRTCASMARRSSRALHEGTGGGFPQETVDALWELVWRGVVTNDTLHPLRAFARARGGAQRTEDRGVTFRSRRLIRRRPRDDGRSCRRHGCPGRPRRDWAAATAQQLLARHGVSPARP